MSKCYYGRVKNGLCMDFISTLIKMENFHKKMIPKETILSLTQWHFLWRKISVAKETENNKWGRNLPSVHNWWEYNEKTTEGGKHEHIHYYEAVWCVIDDVV